MMSSFAKQLASALNGKQTIQNCIDRGKTLRTEITECCGKVEIFFCPTVGREVWHTKCLRCKQKTVV
jgi:hypothetical protein